MEFDPYFVWFLGAVVIPLSTYAVLQRQRAAGNRKYTANTVNIGVPRILQWSGGSQGVHAGIYKGGGARRPGDGSLPVGSRSKALAGGLREEVTQKLKQNVKLVYNF